MIANLEILADRPAIYAFVVVLGLLFGSFANVCIYRWPPSDAYPDGQSVVLPGSHCFACETPIQWYDNTPLLSWLWLRGRCRSCKAAFSPRYLFVEALTGMLFGAAWWFATRTTLFYEPFDVRLIRFGVYAAFIFVLVVIAFIDLDHKLILDKITYPCIPLFYGLGLLLPERHWVDGLVGAAFGYGFIWLISKTYFLVTKREGLGLGDAKLLALVGALLGWPGVLVALFGGSMIGSVIGLGLIASGRKLSSGDGDGDGDGGGDDDDGGDDLEPAPASPSASDPPARPSVLKAELPFGPFLVTGALFYLFAADWIHLKFLLLGN